MSNCIVCKSAVECNLCESYEDCCSYACHERSEFSYPRCRYQIGTKLPGHVCSLLCEREYSIQDTMHMRARGIDVADINEYSCLVCSSTDTRRCGNCMLVRYCGVHCQSVDWTRHKSSCRGHNQGKLIKATKKTKRYVKYSTEAHELRDLFRNGEPGTAFWNGTSICKPKTDLKKNQK